MSNKEEEKVYRLKTETSLELLASSEQPKKIKKGRIIGTLIGAGIGGVVGFMVCKVAVMGSALGGGEYEPSPLLIIFPAVIGGTIGYKIGKYYDKR